MLKRIKEILLNLYRGLMGWIWRMIARIVKAPPPGLILGATAMLITGARNMIELEYILRRDTTKQYLEERKNANKNT